MTKDEFVKAMGMSAPEESQPERYPISDAFRWEIAKVLKQWKAGLEEELGL